jgi:hypothetical protein
MHTLFLFLEAFFFAIGLSIQITWPVLVLAVIWHWIRHR